MSSLDVTTLIELADETIGFVQKYGATGDHADMIRSIRTLTAPLVSGDQVIPELRAAVSVRKHHDLHMAVFNLHRMSAFSRDRYINIQGQVQVVRDALGAYQSTIQSAKHRVDRSIFYSWQSTLPNSDGRGFVLDCLQRAVKRLNATLEQSEREDIPYNLDRDTQSVPGSPAIFDTILDKIDKSGIFVADVTLVGPGQSNSNVMVELGYALAKLGKDRILMVFNTAYGNERDAPFDLGFKRLITYEYKKSNAAVASEDEATTGSKKAQERELLTSKLTHNIREIVGDT